MLRTLYVLICFVSFATFGLLAQTSNSVVRTRIDRLLYENSSSNDMEIEQTLDSLNVALHLSEELKDLDRQVKAYALLSQWALDRLQDFEKALEYLEGIRKLSKKNDNDPLLKSEYHNNLGVLYFSEGTNRTRAFSEFEKAMRIRRQNNLPESYNLLSNYALALISKGSHSEALQALKKSMVLYEDGDKYAYDKRFPLVATTNIGVTFIHMGNLDSAEYYLTKALDISKEIGRKEFTFKALIYLGVFYQEIERYPEAIQILDEAESYLPGISRHFESKALLFEGKSLICAAQGDFEDAYGYNNLKKLYEDSLELVGFREQAFRYDYKMRIDSLERQKQLDGLYADIKQRKLETSVYMIALILVVFLFSAIFVVYRLTKRAQYNKVMAENDRLAQESKLQEAELNVLRSEERAISANLELSARKSDLEELKQLLEQHVQSSDDPQFNQLRIFLNKTKSSLKRNEQLQFLDQLISNTNNEFYDRLKRKHPGLAATEKRLAFMIKLSLSSEELMLIFNISRASLNTKRYRLRQKLQLEDDQNLDDYLANI